jgi:hypothetical protein
MCYNIQVQGIEFTASAARHGYTKQDAIHAMLNCRYGPLTAASRTSGPAPDLYIGPPSTPDALVPLIEVMVVKQGRTLVVFHVQAAQPRNLDLFT